jgi:hypothetical protein
MRCRNWLYWIKATALRAAAAARSGTPYGRAAWAPVPPAVPVGRPTSACIRRRTAGFVTPPAGASGSGMVEHRLRRKASQGLRWKPGAAPCVPSPCKRWGEAGRMLSTHLQPDLRFAKCESQFCLIGRRLPCIWRSSACRAVAAPGYGEDCITSTKGPVAHRCLARDDGPAQTTSKGGVTCKGSTFRRGGQRAPRWWWSSWW